MRKTVTTALALVIVLLAVSACSPFWLPVDCGPAPCTVWDYAGLAAGDAADDLGPHSVETAPRLTIDPIYPEPRPRQ
jgi:hypothetical protein